MIKRCKNPKCNKEFNATGKKVFCSDKCRKAYSHLKISGQVKKTEKPKAKVVAVNKGVREIMGLVVKVTTVPSEKKQIHIEVDLFESSGISDFLKKPAKVIFYDEIEEEKEESDPTDDLFS